MSKVFGGYIETDAAAKSSNDDGGKSLSLLPPDHNKVGSASNGTNEKDDAKTSTESSTTGTSSSENGGNAFVTTTVGEASNEKAFLTDRNKKQAADTHDDDEQPPITKTTDSMILADEKNKPKYDSDLILVLDLDETLWWVPRSPEEYQDLKSQGWKPTEVGAEHGVLRVCDVVDGDRNTIFPLKLRPGVLEFLKNAVLSKKYETLIFTRSRRDGIAPLAIEVLAKAVAEYAGEQIASANELFARCRFSDSCEDVFGLGLWYCKPLKQVVRSSHAKLGNGVDVVADDELLKRVVIVDDRSDSYFSCNRFNGIPVREFCGIRGEDDTRGGLDEVDYGDDSRQMFERLTELLESLEPVHDVRPVLKEMFKDANRKYL